MSLEIFDNTLKVLSLYLPPSSSSSSSFPSLRLRQRTETTDLKASKQEV
jgi:hypothetical protein